ncbi:hypothetical protein OK016_16585 [Vibrio chagasii]|nr:hypothetical protein [Vibrio chagasii]
MDAQCKSLIRGVLFGGTIANITALWVARNNALKAQGSFKGVEKKAYSKPPKHYIYEGLAILISERGHYS